MFIFVGDSCRFADLSDNDIECILGDRSRGRDNTKIVIKVKHKKNNFVIVSITL